MVQARLGCLHAAAHGHCHLRAALSRLSSQDYCGLVSEEAVRKNFLLIYELLDEVIDYGYPQISSSEALKEFVLNEPVVLKQARCKHVGQQSCRRRWRRGLLALRGGWGPRQRSDFCRWCARIAVLSSTAQPACGAQRPTGGMLMPGAASRGPTGVIKSILDTNRTSGGRRDEIFVDIIEKISCTFNSAGYIQTSQIDGSVQAGRSRRATAHLLCQRVHGFCARLGSAPLRLLSHCSRMACASH